MTAPSVVPPAREDYPDDTPFCADSCGRPATETRIVGTIPGSAPCLPPEDHDGLPMLDTELVCAWCL